MQEDFYPDILTVSDLTKEIKTSLEGVPTQYFGWMLAMSRGDPEPLPEIISIVKSYMKYKDRLKLFFNREENSIPRFSAKIWRTLIGISLGILCALK